MSSTLKPEDSAVQVIRLERSLNWWNIVTIDGYILASYDHCMKPWARLYQKIASHTMLTDGQIAKTVRAYMMRGISA